MALLSYSLVHCTDEMIEEILHKRMSLKNEILVNRMGKTVTKQPSPETDDTKTTDSKPTESQLKMVKLQKS